MAAKQRRVIAEIAAEPHVTGADVIRAIAASDATRIALLRKVARDISFWDPTAKAAATELADQMERDLYAPVGGFIYLREGEHMHAVPVTKGLLAALRSESEEEIELAIRKSGSTPARLE